MLRNNEIRKRLTTFITAFGNDYSMMKRILFTLTLVACSARLVAQDLPDYVPADGLIAWWPFTANSADDLSGNANHGQVNGNVLPVPDRFGNDSSAYSFPGALPSYINVDINESADTLVSGITLSAWYHTTTTSGDRRLIQIGNTDGGGRGLMVMLTGGFPWTTRVNSGFTATMAGRIGSWPTNVMSIKNEWTHLVFKADFTTGQWWLYHNGQLATSGQTPNPVGFDPLNLSDLDCNIGRKAPFGFFDTDAWSGLIDDMGLWKRPLTDCEILDLYAAQANSLNVAAGGSVAACPDEELILFAESNGNVFWENGALNGDTLLVQSADTLLATATIGGCSVSDTLFIELLQPSFATDSITACGQFTWIDGTTYTENTDSAVWVLQNALGCDSVVTLNLNVLQPATFTDAITACESFTWQDGITYTESVSGIELVFVAANGCDSIVTLDLVLDTLAILEQPADGTTTVTEDVTFTVAAGGSNPTFQWQSDLGNGFEDLLDGSDYSGATTETLSVLNTQFVQDGQPFRCVVNAGTCADTTDTAILLVCGSVTQQPVNQTVISSSSAVFTVASNDLTAGFQWQSNIGFGFQDLDNAGQYSGTNTPVLIVSNVNAGNNNQLFRCVITTGSCTVESDEALLTVNPNTSVSESTAKPFRTYPNPTHQAVTIETGAAHIGSPYTLFDLHGRALLTGLLSSERTVLDISAFASGVYFVTVETNTRHTLRVIKQ